MRRQALHQDLASAFMAEDEASISTLLQEYTDFSNNVTTEEADDSVYVGASIEDIMQTVSKENMIQAYPKAMNDRLGGGLPKPCHILIYARPETGKSATCINLSSGFINQGHKTLYVCNEDNSQKMLMRFICRLSGMTQVEVQSNPKAAMDKAKSRGYDNLIFAGLTPGTLPEIAGLIEKYEPECVIVDQIHNLSHKNDNKVERLAIIANDLRSMSNKYGVVMVSVTQAGDSADGKLTLGLGDVDYSNTGIPGAVDSMIGIGVDEKLEREGFRFMSFPKNKIGGGDHTPIKVRLEPAYSRVTST